MGKKDFVIQGGKMPVYNHYQLSIPELKKQHPEIQLSVLRFSGEEALNTPWCYTIEITSATRDILADSLINTTAQLLFYPDGQPWQSVAPRILRGVITGFQQCDSSADETRYVVTLQPRLALLKNSLMYAVYQHKSVPGVVEDILNRWAFSSLDYHFRLNTQYPVREFYIAYAESDLDFIERHLARIGVFYYFTWDEENHRDVLVLGDTSQAYGERQDIAFRHPLGLFDGGRESLWDISVSRQSVAARTKLNDEYYRNAQDDLLVQIETDLDKPALTGELYRYGENYQQQGREVQALPEQGRWFVKRRQERLITEQVTFDGMSNGMDIRPGMVISPQGKAWPDAPDGLLVVSTSSTRISRDTAYVIRFTAVPVRPHISYRPPLKPWPHIGGTLLARVTSPVENAQYAELDEHGRYRVRFQFDLNALWQPGFESVPVRLAKPYAGNVYGWHFPLIAGTQVMIAFTNGDPDRPYILCSMHDSRHEDHVNLYNYQRNVLRTPANNKLRFEDRRGYEHVKLSTEFGGKSQLSLGHIVDNARNKRGEGFELRTDSTGTLRAAKGLYLTADAQITATGQVLEMAPAISLVNGAVSQISDWQTITQSHHNLQPDASHLKAYLAAVDQLKSPAMLLSAPEGIGAVSPKSILINSGTTLHLQSQTETSIASGQRIQMNAGQAISLLAHQEGIRIVSGQGPLAVESHGDTLGLTALKDISVQTVQGELRLTAKNGIVLGCAGATIRITPQGDIQIHSPGKTSIRGVHTWNTPASEETQLPELPKSVCKDCLKKAQQAALAFVPRG
ncbi:type VI secretion system secreted protein VgrG [Gibbsiella quercinecans]|uniref:Type IV secretion protein Rhs n=1 Tax=Gibbsiella quercinecans TaxID=929813 RepID=A0A250AYJ1_9GAMM|nr:type VI secretion system Vgr family protein [Gibbsiella quercinecans]ATA18931.1 type IV secretion protein Rhs [Gibbsiella quercinecans]RLM15179.1 type IV secretion protein Rhs [Gibbsiella quercinecans]TCT91518.1 type VI secretion system secreted protein VgrG [Gibbsiella quercinecans]